MASKRPKVRTTVEIYGEQYTIVGDEDIGRIRKIAKEVDEKMHEIKDKNPYLDSKKLAVLTAVNAVNECMKLKEEQDRKLKNKRRKSN